MLYRKIDWWPGAFHVYDGDKRIGIVNKHDVRLNGVVDREVWFAHNEHFLTVVVKRGSMRQREFATRTEAAEAIPTGVIHQPVDAFSGSYD